MEKHFLPEYYQSHFLFPRYLSTKAKFVGSSLGRNEAKNDE